MSTPGAPDDWCVLEDELNRARRKLVDEWRASQESYEFVTPYSVGSGQHKTHKRFPADGTEKEVVEWFLDNVRASQIRASMQIYCTTLPEHTGVIRSWIKATCDIDISTAKNCRQIQIFFGVNFSAWLEKKADEHDFGHSTKFHDSLATTKTKIEELVQRTDRERTLLIDKLYLRDGRRGCYDCGREDGRLEFDHTDPRQKVANVSALLFSGKWEAATTEADKCTVRCTSCHRKKTLVNKDYRRKHASDPKIERETEKMREYHRIYRERGKQRLREAKLHAGLCVMCRLACTADNITDFDFDHIDESTKKCEVSKMSASGDELFNAELAKCQLLCTRCHVLCTEKRRENIAAKQRTTRHGRKRAADPRWNI